MSSKPTPGDILRARQAEWAAQVERNRRAIRWHETMRDMYVALLFILLMLIMGLLPAACVGAWNTVTGQPGRVHTLPSTTRGAHDSVSNK
jgi:hypothetical protein